VFLWLPARATVPADAIVPVEPADDADVVAVGPAPAPAADPAA